MVAAISTAINKTANPTRPPLLLSEKDNGVQSRKPRGKQVSSRYLSPSSSSSTIETNTSTTSSCSCSSSSSISKRFGSPLVSRSSNSFSSSKRSQSVDRNRPISPNTEAKHGNASEISASTRILITSTRSLSVSFQGEAFSLPISKAKAVSYYSASPNPSRKATPERRKSTLVRDHGENSRTLDQHRWPGRSRDRNSLLSRSFDISSVGSDGHKSSFGSGLSNVNSLEQSLIIDERRLSSDIGNAKQYNADAVKSSVSEFSASDSDSVSSGSTSDFGSGIGRGQNGARAIVVSPRFWQESSSRLRQLPDSGSPLCVGPIARISSSSKIIQSKRFASDFTVASSPTRGATRPASPSKLRTPSASSPSRGISSPSRVRLVSSNPSGMPSILSFSADIRRGKIGEDRIVNAHMLRLLYNRQWQWRFVNARADAAFFVQRQSTEKNLWNAWVRMSELRHLVTLNRVKFLLLRQKLKLTYILKGQITCLEEWSRLDGDHTTYLEGAIEALKASTLRLPIVGKAIADLQNLKDAIASAVDVMHVMASSICLLSSRVEEINSLVAELVKVTVKGKILLGQCKDFMFTFAALQVKNCSLRTHLIQSNRLSTTSSLSTCMQ